MALNCVCVCEFFFSQRFFTRSVNSSEKVKKKKKKIRFTGTLTHSY